MKVLVPKHPSMISTDTRILEVKLAGVCDLTNSLIARYARTAAKVEADRNGTPVCFALVHAQ